MIDNSQPQDDLEAYVTTFSDEERKELAQAHAALDLAALLHETRKARRLTQQAAASQTGFKQQAISRWENAHASVELSTLRRYLAALGYSLDLVISDSATGEVVSLSSTTKGATVSADETRHASAAASKQ